MDQRDRLEAVAVVGMGCKLPGAADVEEFWRLLMDNQDAVTPVPEDRFDVAAYYAAEPGTPGKTCSRHGGFLDDPFGFDPSFFGIAPAEARSMDPQQRLVLTVAWEAVESAGIRPSALAASRTGVFIGQATGDFSEEIDSVELGIREATGSRIRAMASGRLSYALDLRGPSMLVDTACSSSLVAVHLARQSLLTRESTLAIAGGVNVILSPKEAIAYSQAGMLAPDGHCKFGDANADGFVRSEGVGVVVLKRLEDALRDGDPVLALLLGSSVTNDGRGSGLLLQPAVSGQTAMLSDACASAGINAGQLDYVEAHGTGTTVGDSVELRALAAAQASRAADRPPLAIGSVKGNIGHTEAAAGIAGLIKTVLIAQHGLLPATLHLEQPTQLLADGELPLEIVTSNRPLVKAGPRALLGVSSFGLSGTNAHVVIGEYAPAPAPERAPVPAPIGGRPELLVLSARSAASLRELARSYAQFLGPDGAGTDYALAEVCAAAALRQDAHPFRLWTAAASAGELAANLLDLAEGREIPDGGLGAPVFGAPRNTVFVFPGQGSQWVGMGRTLLDSSPDFRRAMAACDRAVREEAGWSPLELLTGAEEEFPDRIDRVQPLLWAVEVALARTWRAMGVRPDVCVGHSMGEVAAACVSGALDLRSGAAVICRRSRLMRRVSGQGAMLAAEVSAEEARRLVGPYGDKVCVAVENSPRATVLAGDAEALHRIGAELTRRGAFNRLVKVNVASHSAVMDTLREDLLRELAPVRPHTATTPLVSTVHCAPVTGREMDASYWMDNLRRPVRFADSVRLLGKDADNVFLEISPHPVLLSAIEETLQEGGGASGVVASGRRGRDERVELTHGLGRLFALGGRVAWDRWFTPPSRQVPLPRYAWEKADLPRRGGLPQRSEQVRDFPVARQSAGVELHGLAPVPPALYLASVFEAAAAEGEHDGFSLVDARLGQEFLDIGELTGLTVRLSGPSTGERLVTVEAQTAAPAGTAPSVRLRGRLLPAGAAERRTTAALNAALSRCTRYVSGADFLAAAEARGYRIGEQFQAVEQVWRRDGEAVARMRLTAPAGGADWETCFQPLLAALPRSLSTRATYVPVSFGRVRLFGDLGGEFWSRAAFRVDGPGTARADVQVLDPAGLLLAEFRDLRLSRLVAPAPTGRRRMAAGLLSAVARRLSGEQSPRQDPLPARPALPAPATATASAPAPAQEHRQRTPGDHPPQDASDRSTPDRVAAAAAGVLGMPVDRLDARRPLCDYGLDSLLASQLRGRLRTALGIDLPIGRLLGPESLERLVASVGASPA